jgi:hypothetical protein
VDLNRNFDWFFNSQLRVLALMRVCAAAGTSTHPCSEVYAGTAAFSEPETRAIQQFITANRMNAFITLHSYGQYWFAPYGHKNYTYPPDYSSVLVSEHVCTRVFYAVQQPLALSAIERLRRARGKRYFPFTPY